MLSEMPSIATAAHAFRQGAYTPRDLVELCAARIQEWEPRVQAWVELGLDAAMREADQQWQDLRAGHDRGPLQGIPLGIKDLIDVAGWPTRAGSPLRAHHRASTDAPLVQRLRQAGAILLGKTVTTEFACFDPAATRNPWDATRTPGGSSSGSAAVVALRQCPAALGSQTGGSIIRPASFCGVAGFKPTWGRVSLDGVVPVSRHLDHVGPLGMSVADLAHVFAAIDQQPGRPTSQLLAHQTLAPEAFASHFPTARAVRFIVFREHFDELADEESRVAFASVVAQLRETGLDVVDGKLPEVFPRVIRGHRVIMAVEAAQAHARDFAEHESSYGPHVSSLIREGLDLMRAEPTTGEYQEALRLQVEFRRSLDQLLGDQCVALTPATLTPAPGRETTGDPRFNSPWSLAGIPAVTIPCGLSSDGLPCGLQLIGRGHTDYRLLDVAADCESLIDFQARPSGAPD